VFDVDHKFSGLFPNTGNFSLNVVYVKMAGFYEGNNF